jgi:hypothetical protein
MATSNVQKKLAAASSSASTLLPMPVTPYASINTDWSNIGSAGFATCVAAAPDTLGNSQDIIWVGAAAGGVMTYSIVNAAWTSVASDTVMALTALSATEAYAAPISGGPLIHYQNGQSSTLPAFPNNDIVTLLASAPDGTLWAASANGCYLWNGNGWTTTNTNGFALTALATTGTSGAWADSLGTLLAYSEGGGWQPVTEFSGQTISSVGAAPDGSVWIAGSGSQPFQVLQGDGTWATVPMGSPGDLAMSRMSAASRYRCYVAYITDFTTVNLACLSFGITDQLATPWPAMTADQTALYTAISQFLLTTPDGAKADTPTWDIRAHYNDTLADLTTWYTNLKTETWKEFKDTYPGPYKEEDWKFLQPQLLTELTYAGEVNTLFGNINGLIGAIESLNDNNLPPIPTAVGLGQPNQPPNLNMAIVVLGGIVDALMWGLASVVGDPAFPELGFAMSAGASMLGTGITAATTGGPASPDDRTRQVTIDYLLVSQKLNSIYTGATTASGNVQAAIVKDWGMLGLVGNSCFTGFWTWPDQLSSTIANYAQNAYQIWFYQVFMTAMWEVVYVLWTEDPGLWNNRTADYLTYSEPNIGMGGTDFYFSLQIGGDDNYLNPSDMGPYPTKILMEAIWGLGVQPADFFKNRNGWINPVDDATAVAAARA